MSQLTYDRHALTSAAESGFEILALLPYSLDKALLEYRLFLKLKPELRGRKLKATMVTVDDFLRCTKFIFSQTGIFLIKCADVTEDYDEK